MFDIRPCVYSAAGVREIRSNVRGNNNVLFVACVISVYYYDYLYVRACVSVCVYTSRNRRLVADRGDRFANRLLPAGSHHFFLFVFYFSYLSSYCFIFSLHVV